MGRERGTDGCLCPIKHERVTIVLTDNKRDQLRIGAISAHDDCSVGHSRDGAKNHLDFGRFDALSAYLDLLVDSSDDVQQTVVSQANEIACSQNPQVWRTWIRPSSPRSALPSLPFTHGGMRGAQNELSDFACGHRIRPIQDRILVFRQEVPGWKRRPIAYGTLGHEPL